MSARVRGWVVVAVLCWPAAHAGATVMVELDVEELVLGADVIVHARVERTGTQMAVAGSRDPHTLARLRVVRWIKGAGGESVVVRERGGYWATGGTRVDGTPSYRVGEEVIVFLVRDEHAYYRTFSMAQGKFVVRRATKSDVTVERDLRGVSFARWKSRVIAIEPGTRRRVALRSFLDLVEQTVEVFR